MPLTVGPHITGPLDCWTSLLLDLITVGTLTAGPLTVGPRMSLVEMDYVLSQEHSQNDI